MHDSLFCRKCGEKRPLCACGNTFLPDSFFCRKCGEKRPAEFSKAAAAAAGLTSPQATTAAASTGASTASTPEPSSSDILTPLGATRTRHPSSMGTTSNQVRRNSLLALSSPDQRRSARERWGKIRQVITESPQLALLVQKMPQDFRQDMAAFAIPREDLRIASRAFASGGGGQIFKGTYNRCAVAAKAIYSQMDDRASKLEFHQEFSMLATLHHPNIVTFYGISEDVAEGVLYIVEEFCAGGDLAKFLKTKGNEVTPVAYARIATELLGGVRYMHDKGIAHRDLKPQNVLLTESGRVKICDLGQARNFRKAAVTAAVGTAPFMPPEAFDEIVTNDASYAASKWDVYSLGMTLWQLWYRKEPWEGMSTHKIYASVMKGKRPKFDEPSPPEDLKAIIESMWSQDHAQRPTLRQACALFEKEVASVVRSLSDEPPTPMTPMIPNFAALSRSSSPDSSMNSSNKSSSSSSSSIEEASVLKRPVNTNLNFGASDDNKAAESSSSSSSSGANSSSADGGVCSSNDGDGDGGGGGGNAQPTESEPLAAGDSKVAPDTSKESNDVLQKEEKENKAEQGAAAAAAVEDSLAGMLTTPVDEDRESTRARRKLYERVQSASLL